MKRINRKMAVVLLERLKSAHRVKVQSTGGMNGEARFLITVRPFGNFLIELFGANQSYRSFNTRMVLEGFVDGNSLVLKDERDESHTLSFVIERPFFLEQKKQETIADSWTPVQRARAEAHLRDDTPTVPLICWKCGVELSTRVPDRTTSHCITECPNCCDPKASIVPVTYWNGLKIQPNK